VTQDYQGLPDNPSWLLKQALRAFDKRHYRCASWLCWIAIHLNPNNYFALCEYAQSLYHLGKKHDREAASIYKRAIEINPTHPLAHAGLGLIHYENAKRIDKEHSVFPGGSWLMFADEKSPENENKFSLVTSYADSQVGNRKIAIKELEEAANFTSDKNDKVSLLDMAAEIHCITNIADGIEAYKRVLDTAPDDVLAHFHLADCYAASYYRHKQSAPTSYYGEHFSGNDKLAIKEYKFVKENAPELASDLESILARFNIKIDKEC
jgi:tetratricopeptide (TPR) repeat protein